MIREVVNISIDGSPQPELAADIVEVEVEEDVNAADVFRIRVALAMRRDGSWSYLDDDRFRPWRRVAVDAGYPDAVETLIDGYTTHVEAKIGRRRGSYLEISGMDMTAAMDLEEKQVAWPNKKDHEIAQAIFGAYGLSHEVEDTVAAHTEEASTILQTESDIRFLRRLAARNGFECHVRGGTGYFRGSDMQSPPQPILAIEFGSETNVSGLSVRVDATPPAVAEIRRIDPLEKTEEIETQSGSPVRALGDESLAEIRGGLPEGRVLVRNEAAASSGEMRGRLRGACDGATGFVRVEGEIDSRAYRAVLRAKRLVTIKGAGAAYSGLYYVTKVRHTFTVRNYTQYFEARRNGIGLTGEEAFEASLLPALASLGGATPAAGNRVLPAQQTAGGA